MPSLENCVTEYIAKALPDDNPLHRMSYGLLRDVVEEAFLLKGLTGSKTKKAQCILSCLFGHLVKGFSLDVFLGLLPKKEVSPFLSQLLYHIYYLNLPAAIFHSCDTLFFYLYKLYAAEGEPRVIRRIFKSLSHEKQLACLKFVYRHYEEGTFHIFQQARRVAAPQIRKLLSLMERFLVWPKDCFSEDNLDIVLKRLSEQIKMRLLLLQRSVPAIKKSTIRRFVNIFGFYGAQSINSQAMQAHIEALEAGSKAYVEGLKLITFALPTAAKDLSKQVYLPSLVKALIPFKSLNIPIFVFDQSEKKLYEKNSRFIKKMKAPIIHLNADEILEIGSKLDVTSLLITDTNGQFGYGGARNAIFLIAPLLKYYYCTERPKDLLAYVRGIPAAILQKDLQEVVLKETRGPCILHMGDDDVFVPPSIIYSDALFAYTHQHEFFTRYGWVAGRKTTWTEVTFRLDALLARPELYTYPHKWHDTAFSHGMSGLLTKPKICLNIPHGQEEFHFRTLFEYREDFRVPLLHISGYRFPKVKIPTNRYVGLASLLQRLYIDTIGKTLITDLLDPETRHGKCALPWNQGGLTFQNLRDALQYVLTPAVVEEMQRRFWKNLKLLALALKGYDPKQPGNLPYATLHLALLNTLDMNAIASGIPEKYKKEIKEILEVFSLFKLDGQALLQACLEANPTSLPLDSPLPMTHALFLLIQAIGDRGFQKALKSLLPS